MLFRIVGDGAVRVPSARTAFSEMYGFTRRSRPALPVSSPSSVPASDTRFSEKARGTGDQNEISFTRRRRREKLMPHVASLLRSKRSALNGMRISSVQPSACCCVRTSHTASQLRFNSRPSSATCRSCRAPLMLVEKTYPLR